MPLSRFMPPRRARASASSLAAVVAIAATALSGCGSSTKHNTATNAASPTTTSGGYTSSAFASGVAITISTPTGTTPITQPDDITQTGGKIFAAFQNDVGPQGQATPKGTAGTGNLDSTVVEFSSSGSAVAHWDLLGHVDGLTADPATGKVIATANEDANAKLYEITPGTSTATEYKVPSPLPSNGGLDAISFWHGMMLISASAPGTAGKAAPQASYPAVYVATLNSSSHTVSLKGLFSDEATAAQLNSGKSGSAKLALVDPDSNAVVPSYVPHVGGDFELTSQADQEQIFVGNTSATQLSVLKLTQSVDDSTWPSPGGTLYITDGTNDLIFKITGPFSKGTELTSVTPCDGAKAPTACPAPGFPQNYLGIVNMSTGSVTTFPISTSKSIQAKGEVFVP